MTRRLLLISAALAMLLTVMYFNGNILVFTVPPVQVCVGWPDDNTFSYWCTPDYTARRIQALEYDVWAWKQSAVHFQELCSE